MVYSQDVETGQWSWIGGDNTKNKPGAYVTKGPHPNNQPGSRRYGVSWTDLSGNLWLFGGLGYASNGEGSLNDLWQYDIVKNQWSWIGGSNTINNPGVYERKDFDAKNQPGARAGALSWTDLSGNLWLFGGFGNASDGDGLLNDLWQFNIVKNQWNWISGDSTINTPGLLVRKGADPGNKLAGRAGAASWIDKTGNLWLFGGFRRNSNQDVQLNDLWKYDIAKNQWSWIGGDSTLNNPGEYVKEPDLKGQPGARRDAVSWVDTNGDLWLFGGVGYTPRGNGVLGDLWKYSIVKNQWSWIGGENSINSPGRYVKKGPDPNNKPGARWDAVSWSDKTGVLWLFGGDGYTETNGGLLNDLWQFNILKNEWSWTGGENTINNPGVYVKAPDPTSRSGSRAGAVSWTDLSGNLWLFGGEGYASSGDGKGSLNDLWKFIPCSPPSGTINITTKTLCFGDSINLVVTSPGSTSYQWYRNNDPIAGATSAGYLAKLAGVYKVRMYTQGGCTALAGDSIVVKLNPSINATASGIVHASCTSNTGSATISATGGTGPYAYSLDGASFGTINKFEKLAPGNHKVTVRDNAGCTFELNFAINQSNSTLTATASGIVHANCTSSSGSATINATGGTPPYTYGLDGGSFGATNKFDKLVPGKHVVAVRDSGGCSFNVNFEVNQSTSTLTATAVDIVHSNCTSSTGSAMISATGGTGPYAFSLDGGSFGAVNKFDKLPPGTHKVTVRDNLGCTFDLNFTVNQTASTLAATTSDIVHSTCTSSTGSATISATGGTGPYVFSLDGGSFGAVNKFEKLPPGTHKVTVRDNAGCTFDLNFTINQSTSTLTATVVDMIQSACTSNTGSATITATGGNPPYIYSLDGGNFAAANKFDKLAPGKHNVTVRDSRGCTFTLTMPAISAINPGITYSTVIVSAGQPYPLSTRSNIGNDFTWRPTDGLDNPKSPAPTVTTNKDVTYHITMTAASGCITVDTQRVLVAKPVTANNNKDSVVAVPTAFTPNSNTVNDRLKPIPYSVKTLTYFKVYNRWGQLVFETTSVGVGWDGTLKGKPQPTETYTWMLECISGSGARVKRSGRSLLIR